MLGQVIGFINQIKDLDFATCDLRRNQRLLLGQEKPPLFLVKVEKGDYKSAFSFT